MAQSQAAYEKSVRRANGIGAKCRSKHSRRNTPSGSISCGYSPLATDIARQVRELVQEGKTKAEAREAVGIEANGRYMCLIVHIKRALPLWDKAAHDSGAKRENFRMPGEPSDRDYARELLKWTRTVPATIDVNGKPGNCWIVNPDDAAQEYLSYRDIPDTGIVELRAPTQVLNHLQLTHPEWMETYRAPITARVSVIAAGDTTISATVEKKMRFMRSERIDYAERVAFGVKADNGGMPVYHGAAPMPSPIPAPMAQETRIEPNTLAIVASILPGESAPESVQVNFAGTVRTVYSIVAEYLATRETHPAHATILGQAIAMVAQGMRTIRDEIDALPSPEFTESDIVANQVDIGEGIHLRREIILRDTVIRGTVSKND